MKMTVFTVPKIYESCVNVLEEVGHYARKFGKKFLFLVGKPL
jgi:hypothetical protein